MPSRASRGLRLSSFLAWTLQAFSLGLVTLSPWWYGGVTWQAQQLIFLAAIVLAGLLAIHVVIAATAGGREWIPGGLVWLLVALGCFALLQTPQRFGWDAASGYSPPSVQLQRWALGSSPPPPAIVGDLVQPQVLSTRVPGEPCCLSQVPETARRLALSVEPVTTRAASASLFLASLLVWVGNSLFSRKSSYPWLLSVLTILGVLVGLFGILNVLVPSTKIWLGLDRANSFASFVSRNSAGAFLNITFAAALGLVFWCTHRAHRNLRHRHQDSRGGIYQVAGVLQRFIATLDAPQIASFLALIWIALAILQTLSRGAVVSGLAALLVALVFAMRGKQSILPVAGTILIAALTIGFMVFFQLDERVLTRLESLGEIDVESDAQIGRLYIWNVSWDAARYYSWFGSGLGTFSLSTLPFQRPHFPGRYFHAENIYLETLVTLGFLGFLVLICSLIWTYSNLRKIYVSDRFRDFVPLQVAGIFLFFSQLIHGMVDFALILPGVYIPAALLLGASLGASQESHRVVRELKGQMRGRGVSHEEPDMENKPRRVLAAVCAILALASMFALHYGRKSAVSLAAGESIERRFKRLDQLPLNERDVNRVNALIDMAASYGVTLQDSPQLLRLAADSLCFDDRMRQWKSQTSGSERKIAWNETDPFLVRLANDRIDDANRESWLRSIGGTARLDNLRKAGGFYAQSRAMSPLDWHALWGNLYCSLDCSASDSAAFLPVVQRTSSHLPIVISSASIFFNGILTEDDRLRLWSVALRTSPSAAIGIGRIMTTQYADGSVPIDVFPKNPYQLYALTREVFTQATFPRTHETLCQRALEAIPSLSKLELYRIAKLTADIANEAGDWELEKENLRKYVQLKPDDDRALVRLTQLEIQAKEWDDAALTLRKLRDTSPSHPSIPGLSERIKRRFLER